ncbi:hypothetical protein [Acetivibrio straminisolvens]|nr:hypothetical protein [Acetivibrio straminisolvens]
MQSANKFSEIMNLLDKAKEPSIDSEKYTEDALDLLVELLSKANPQDISSESISKLSDRIRIHENNNSRIIEYRQSPEDFGNSGRRTWKVFQYYAGNSVFMIEKNMPYDLEFYRVINIDNKPVLYTYVRNFEVNQHKVHIFAYTFSNQSITKINSIDFESIDTNLWGYDKEKNMLWSKKCHSTFIESVSLDGKEVVIKGWDTDGNECFLNFKLKDEGVYTCL